MGFLLFSPDLAQIDTDSVMQAIMRAVDDWGVDIISLSFAFDEPNEEVSDAISYAVYKKVLIFAAASNNSGNKRVCTGYPAREDGVICVYSTDDQNNKSYFSPKGRERSYNFAILGENLEAAWPSHLNKGIS